VYRRCHALSVTSYKFRIRNELTIDYTTKPSIFGCLQEAPFSKTKNNSLYRTNHADMGLPFNFSDINASTIIRECVWEVNKINFHLFISFFTGYSEMSKSPFEIPLQSVPLSFSLECRPFLRHERHS